MRRLTTHRRHDAGLTLIEMMVGLTIAGFLAMTAAPFFGEYMINSKLREGGHALLSEALFAQSEGIKRNRTMRLSLADTGISVLDMTVPTAPVTVHQRELPAGVSVGTGTLDFGSEGRPATFGDTGSFNLSMSGQTCSSDVRCPGLRVDAGGAVRLCANHLSGCV
jgi:type IV fimbrial biogenesis protein FimT